MRSGRTSIPLLGKYECSSCTNDQLRGRSANRVAADMGRDPAGLQFCACEEYVVLESMVRVPDRVIDMDQQGYLAELTFVQVQAISRNWNKCLMKRS